MSETLSHPIAGDSTMIEESERPCTPPLPQDDDHPDSSDKEQIQGGSIILIDPSTNGIIGTLTPASPNLEPEEPPNLMSGEVLDEESTLSGGAGGGRTPDRRDPTYSYRLSISDVSLRTVTGSGEIAGDGVSQHPTQDQTIYKTPQRAFKSRAGAETGATGGKDGKSAVRGSWMTDDASFWTARGTLCSDSPAGAGEEREREVLVAYVKTETPLCNLFPPYIPTPTRPARLNPNLTIGTHRSNMTNTTESPFPSRILHLFPRLSTLPRGGIAGSGLPSNVTQGLSWPSTLELNAGSMIASAGSQAEKAFWRLVMPGISGIYGWTGVLGQAYEQLAGYLPIPLLSSSSTDNAPLLIDSSTSSSVYQSRLYSEETIYTLHLPESGGEGNDELGIGPTVRPVWVRKRAALPVFVEREEGWGRDGMIYNV